MSDGTYDSARWLDPVLAPVHPSILYFQNLLWHTVGTQEALDTMELLNQVQKF